MDEYKNAFIVAKTKLLSSSSEDNSLSFIVIVFRSDSDMFNISATMIIGKKSESLASGIFAGK